MIGFKCTIFKLAGRLKGMKKFLLSLLSLAFLASSSIAGECVSEKELYMRSVIIEKYGRGAGSGVILDERYILTAYHVVEDIERIWIRLPGEANLPVPAPLVRHDKEADIALLQLEEPLVNVPRLHVVHSKDMHPNMLVFLGAYAFADPGRFGMVEGHYLAPARLKEGGPVTASFIHLKKRTYGGDSGGGVFNCFGDLVGIEVGNLAHQNRPYHIAAVSPAFIQWVLRAF